MNRHLAGPQHLAVWPRATAGRERRRLAPLFLVAGMVSAVLLTSSFTGVLASFSAAIRHSSNSVGTTTLLMSETQGGATCMSTATGVTIASANSGSCSADVFGALTTMMPGVPSGAQIVILKNVGASTANSVTLTPLGCTQSGVGTRPGASLTFCSQVFVNIRATDQAACILPSNSSVACPATPTSAATLLSLGSGGSLTLQTSAWLPGASVQFEFILMTDLNAPNNTQGMKASQQLSWVMNL
jgi:hypothetical protein